MTVPEMILSTKFWGFLVLFTAKRKSCGVVLLGAKLSFFLVIFLVDFFVDSPCFYSFRVLLWPMENWDAEWLCYTKR